MTKGEFYQTIEQFITGMLPEQFANYTPELVPGINQTGEYTGLVLRTEEENIAPVINLDEMYEKYGLYEELEMLMAVANDVTEIYESEDKIRVENMRQDVIRVRDDYEYAKGKLFLSMASMPRKESNLSDLHKQVGDLQVQVRIMIGQMWTQNEAVNASIVVNEDLLKNWEKGFDEVYEEATKNMSKILPTVIEPMDQLLKEMSPAVNMDFENDIPLLVVRNQSQNHGAANLFLPGIMDELADRVGGSYLIIPSSVHEVLILPPSMMEDGLNKDMVTDVEKMIQEINETFVSPEDRLSDHAYYYDAERKEISIASEALLHIDHALSTTQKKMDVENQTPQVMVDEVAKNIIEDVIHPNFS